MAKQVNYEVQVMQNGRWTIHARYLASESEEAITDAKQIAIAKIGDVHVLRDIYDSETGTSVESIVYSSKLNDRKKATGEGDNTSSSGTWSADDDTYDNIDWGDEGGNGSMLGNLFNEGSRNKKSGKRKNSQPAQTTLPWFLIKLLLIILLSFGAAMGSLEFASTFLHGINLFGIPMYGAARDNALIILFLGTFGITALILAFLFLRNVRLKRGKPMRRRRNPAPDGTMAGIKSNTTPPPIASTTANPVNDPVPDPGDDPGFADGNKLVAPHGQEEPEPEPVTMTEDKKSEKPSVPDILTPHEEKQKTYMAGFTKSVLEGVTQDKKPMSSFVKFGASLFLAGACEAMAQKNKIGEQTRNKIIAYSLQSMGFKPDHAHAFAKKYEQYLIQAPRYMQVFQAGRSTMNTSFTDPSQVGKDAAVAMNEWANPKPAEEQSNSVAIMFTDIVDFTAMTQELGDAGAQHMLRIHNRAVREALGMWNGNEIKHTGDGIMASFNNAAHSIDAAIQIQRAAVAHTAQNTDKPLHLKIGINAGNPIAEDNDLYGVAVQMAARIVNEAEKEEIFVSELMHKICADKGHEFKNRGAYPMKGFNTVPTLYEVVWRAS